MPFQMPMSLGCWIEYNGYDRNHHHAMDDAEAYAWIAIKIFDF